MTATRKVTTMNRRVKNALIAVGAGAAIVVSGGTAYAFAGGSEKGEAPPVAKEVFTAERTRIGDVHGHYVGTYDRAEGEAASQRAGDQMARDGITAPGLADSPEASEKAMSLQEAYLTVNAVAVTDDAGKEVGFAGPRFFDLAEYPTAKASAEDLIQASK